MEIPVAPSLPPPPTKMKTGVRILGWSLACLVALWLLAGMLGKSTRAAVQHEEEWKVIRTLGSLRYPEQAAQAKPMCTEKGFSLIEAFEGFPGSYNPVVFKSNPKFCDVEMARDAAEGKSRIHIRLVRENGWKFDDVYFNELEGKKCGQWASYMVEHPLMSTLQFHAEELVGAASATLDFSKSVLEFVNELEKLEALSKPREPENKQRPDATQRALEFF